MKMRNFAIAIVLIMTMMAAGTQAQAQSQGQSTRAQQQYYVQPPVQVTPKLGVTGSIIAHWGFKISSVEPHSAAARMGLERGDVIKFINHKRIDCLQTFKNALQNAASYNNGHLRLTVDNVRARLGQSHQRIVTVNGSLFPSTPVVYSTRH